MRSNVQFVHKISPKLYFVFREYLANTSMPISLIEIVKVGNIIPAKHQHVGMLA